MKFDNVIGNPPYQKNTDAGRSHATPLYNLFTEKYSMTNSKRCCFVMPSRWFAGGLALDEFRKKMLSRTDIQSIIHKTNDVFPKVDIEGGVSIVYINQYSGQTRTSFVVDNNTPVHIDLTKYDILVKQTSSYSIIDKVLSKTNQFITDIYISKGISGISTNDDRLLKTKPTQNIDSYVKCYTSQTQGFENWIHRSEINNKTQTSLWKVITPEAAHGAHRGFGNICVIKPGEIFNQTYIGFECPTQMYAQNLKTYLETQFANYMLSLRKITHHTSEKVLRWIPLLNMNKEWTSEMCYDYFELTDEEIKTIETTEL